MCTVKQASQPSDARQHDTQHHDRPPQVPDMQLQKYFFGVENPEFVGFLHCFWALVHSHQRNEGVHQLISKFALRSLMTEMFDFYPQRETGAVLWLSVHKSDKKLHQSFSQRSGIVGIQFRLNPLTKLQKMFCTKSTRPKKWRHFEKFGCTQKYLWKS